MHPCLQPQVAFNQTHDRNPFVFNPLCHTWSNQEMKHHQWCSDGSKAAHLAWHYILPAPSQGSVKGKRDVCVSEEKLLPLCGWLIFVPSRCLTFSTGLKSSLLSPVTPTLVVTADRSDSIMTALLPVATSLFFFFVIVVVAALFYPFSNSTLSTAIALPVLSFATTTPFLVLLYMTVPHCCFSHQLHKQKNLTFLHPH